MMVKPKILVTGANGQLGKELKELCPVNSQFEFVFLSKDDLPVQHFELIRNSFEAYHPQYCINCAAYTNVDKAESEKQLAFLVNGEAVGALAAVCKDYNAQFIHISTDYVFDGTAGTPYREDSPVNPVNMYGESKLAGEKAALEANTDTIIIRTSWVYSEFGKNFVKTMLKLMSERTEINVVEDQAGSPTYAADLAECILQIIKGPLSSHASFGRRRLVADAPELWRRSAEGDARLTSHENIFHFCNKGVISWYDFAVAIKQLSGFSCTINPITTDQYPTPAKRPHYSVLDTTRIQKAFGIKMKDWKESLFTCLKKINSNAQH